MIIGCLKEVKVEEHRVSLTPAGAKLLRQVGHTVLVQKNAGSDAGFHDADYKKAGASLVASPLTIVKKADMIVKVKEPLEKEYHHFKHMKGKALFTYLHLAAAPRELTLGLLKNNVMAIAYETVEGNTGALPLLEPMSEVAGVLAVQYGAQYLQKKYGGRGVSLGRIEHTTPARVVVVGGGTVGRTAARTAAGLGSSVVVLQRKGQTFSKLHPYFTKELGKLAANIVIVESTPDNVAAETKKADLLIGSVLVKGARAPRLVNEKMIKAMKPGSVVMDVAIDQGGCIWGSRPTTHTNPTYMLHGKLYCCITNMPGQVPLQSTQALTAATLPYVLKLASLGPGELPHDPALRKGVNTYKGRIAYEAVAKSLRMSSKYRRLEGT